MATLVANGTVVTTTGTLQADILIKDDAIVAVGRRIDRSGDPKIIDASGCFVLAGGIDVHTHCNLTVGNETVSDGFFYGSVAAAHGGTTCFVEHPGFGPAGCGLHHQIALYRQQADREVIIDYGLHGVVQQVDKNILQDIASLPQRGIASLKVYLTYSGRLRDDEIIEVLKAAHRAGVLVTFHAENHGIISSLTEELRQSGRQNDPAVFPQSRPDYGEAEAINRLIALARAAGDMPIYIVHLSTGSGLEIIRKAKQQGSEIYTETCPQYLLLTKECYRQPDHRGLAYIMAPPPRRQVDCDALWEGLADGTIDVVATDHCSFSLAQKLRRGKDDIFNTPGGIPGIETRVPLLFSEGVLKKRIDLQTFTRLTAANPARILGLAPQKGEITVGADADLMVLDPRQEKTLCPSCLHQQVDYTPFAGMTIQGWPTTVMQRGRVVIENENLKATRGTGSFVERKIHQS
ncbi:MAG TPA: dihydropyrimidinase [Desulfobulbaceae bacterium]|nr:dihydropyrimidinase [Desulfobulbaceae bacterium]